MMGQKKAGHSGMQHTGGCLCGAVRFVLRAPLREAVHACHCGQCRRQSGHFVVGTELGKADLEFLEQSGLRWFHASPKTYPEARRGFCGTCGSNLFWDGGGEEISLNLGCLDGPTGLRLSKHIYTADKGDYYDITDGLPQFPGYD